MLQRTHQETKRNPFRLLWIIMMIIVALVVAGVVLLNTVLFYTVVYSASMEDTIETGAVVIGSRTAYDSHEVERGDIIFFYAAISEGEIFVKRVIGLPGETVEIEDGLVYINGSNTPLAEDYLTEEWTVRNDGYAVTVPEGCYYVLGDERNTSYDSRLWADAALTEGLAADEDEAFSYTFVSNADILAKALFCTEPFGFLTEPAY